MSRVCPLLVLLLAATASQCVGNDAYSGPFLPWHPAAPRQSGQSVQLLDAAMRASTVRDGERIVTLITMTSGVRHWVMNLVASFYAVSITSIVVATFEHRSLTACLELNLVCADIRDMFPGQSGIGSGEAYNFGSGESSRMWWAKQYATLELLRRNFSVNGMDADAVVFRDIYSEYLRVVADVGADAIFPHESGSSSRLAEGAPTNIINAGCYFARPQAAPLFQSWVDTDNAHIDQDQLNALAYVSYAFCFDHATCNGVRHAMKTAVWRHPSFYPGGRACISGERSHLKTCDSRLAYLHLLCVQGWKNKEAFWDTLGLWLVDSRGRMREDSTLLQDCPPNATLTWTLYGSFE